MAMDAARFRVLLAEDDPVSRDFLSEAIHSCGAEVTACADGPTALARARAGDWELLILDQHLPGLDGDAVLAALQADANGTGGHTPAIATSAARDSEAGRLLRAGFAEVLPKPLSFGELRAALRRHGCTAPDMLDDDDALRACGSVDSVERLRRLFAEQELPNLQRELDTLGDEDPQRLRPALHRLAASCGFCGATALASACATLQHTLSEGAEATEIRAAVATFRAAVSETRAALLTRLEPPA